MTITWARRIRSAAAAALLLAAAVACSDETTGDGGQAGSDLEGRTFEVSSIVVRGDDRQIVEGTTIALTFEDGGVRANAGCNHLGAGVTIGSDRLVVTDMTTTDMACPGAFGEQDSWVSGLLLADPSWALEGSTLTLATDETTVVLVDAASTTPDAALVGPTWTLDTIIDGETASSVPAGRTATITFGPDGRIVGGNGCNGFSGGYDAGVETLSFRDVTQSLAGCDSEWAALEAHQMSVVAEGEVRYAIDGDVLTLTGTDGRGLAYRAEPA